MMRQRRAYTLIELMVVITVSSTLMVIAVGWIHQSMKLGTVMRDRGDHHQSLLRLSRQLRDDVHRGQSMAVEDEIRLVITTAEEQTITYEIRTESLSRVARDADSVTAQESFVIDPRATARWETSEMPDWISLVVDRGMGTPAIPKEPRVSSRDPMPADLHIRAAVGRRTMRTVAAEVSQ